MDRLKWKDTKMGGRKTGRKNSYCCVIQIRQKKKKKAVNLGGNLFKALFLNQGGGVA